MNTYRLKIGRDYRFGYKTAASENSYDTAARHMYSKEHIESFLNKLEQMRHDYDNHTFWIEEFNPDTRTWSKLKNNSMYALFSKDDPEEEEKPAKQEEPEPYSPWRIIPDNDVPF